MQCQQGENYAMCTEKMFSPNVNAKIGLQNFVPAISTATSRPGRPLVANVIKIKSLIEANRRITTPDIAERLNL